jgi:hypothetical protein
MRPTETVQLIDNSISVLDRELERRIASVEMCLQRQASLMDEVERELDDLNNERLRRELLRTVARYDEAREQIRHEVGRILTHDLFDPLRILVTDIRHDL